MMYICIYTHNQSTQRKYRKTTYSRAFRGCLCAVVWLPLKTGRRFVYLSGRRRHQRKRLIQNTNLPTQAPGNPHWTRTGTRNRFCKTETGDVVAVFGDTNVHRKAYLQKYVRNVQTHARAAAAGYATRSNRRTGTLTTFSFGLRTFIRTPEKW